MNARIKKNKNTQQHGEALRKLGYDVTETEEEFEVEVTGFHEDPVDLTTEEGRGTIQQVVANKQAFTYKTPFTTEMGRRSGIFALRALGPISCLVMRQEKQKKDPTSATIKTLASSLGI